MLRTKIVRTALVTATAAAAALAPAGPAVGAAAGPDVFAGEAEALAVDLRVTAPPELLGQITGGAGELLQKISLTNASLDSDGLVAARTALLDGQITEGAMSSAEDGTTSSQNVQQQNVAGILDVGVGTVEYTADAAQNLSRSFSELAHLRLTLAPLFDGSTVPAEAAAPVQDAVGEATDTVNDLVGELNGALDEVEQAVEDTAGEVVDLPQVVPEELPQVPDVTRVDLLEIRKMWSESTVTTAGELVTSTAHGGVVEASLLGGLVTVPALQFTSTAATAGTPGTATADTELTTVAVQVAGSSVVGIDGDRLTVGDVELDLSDPALEGVPAEDVLGPVADVLAQILDAAGLSVAQGEGVTEVAEDGSSASAATSAFSLSIAPLHAAGQDDTLGLQLDVLPTRAAVSGGVAPAPPAGEPEPNMPRTGGGAAAMLLGTLALGGALMLRRR